MKKIKPETMTRKEKIIEVKGKISQAVADDRISQRCAVEIMDDIDAILALPIDVPSEEEIKNHFTKEHYHYEKGRYTKVDKDRIFGAKWAIEQVIKRNQK
jgi:hypothetical protein